MERVKDTLGKLELRPSKERGQNFIIAPEVLGAIVEFGKPSAADSIVEIGPGLGALTQQLAQFPNLTLIEIEPAFCAALSKKFPHVKIIESDVRQVDFAQIGSELVVFGNLPYSYSTDILFHLIDNAPHLSRAVVMLQREFAERVAAKPGSKAYGVLSVHAQLQASMKLGPIIPGTAFHPPTQVESRLLELTFLKKPVVEVGDIQWFKKVVRASFSQRRRQLHNSLKGAHLVDPDKVAEALATAGIDGMRRAETLTLEEFSKLSSALAQYKITEPK